MVEFAIFLPIMLLILVVAVDFGRVYLGLISVNNMARIGANFAALNPTSWSTPDSSLKSQQRARYQTLMKADAEAINCTLPSALADPVFSSTSVGAYVKVTVDCSFPLITPFLANALGLPDGKIPVSASSTFTVRSGSPTVPGVAGGGLPTVAPSPTAPPTPTPTPDPTATPTPPPGSTPLPTAEATPTLEPVIVAFHGTPTSADSYGGGLPGSVDENQIVGIPTLAITFSNTTIGTMGSCLWNFGDGTTSTSCGSTVNKSYSTRGTYHVTLSVNGQSLTRPGYVLVGCKVPAFSGVRLNNAANLWTAAGFTAGNLSSLAGSGNYLINYQSLAGGLVNPPGGCSAAVIQVGP